MLGILSDPYIRTNRPLKASDKSKRHDFAHAHRASEFSLETPRETTMNALHNNLVSLDMYLE